MAKNHMLDELHVQIQIPQDLPRREVNRIVRVLNSPLFRREVARSIRSLLTRRNASAAIQVRFVR